MSQRKVFKVSARLGDGWGCVQMEESFFQVSEGKEVWSCLEIINDYKQSETQEEQNPHLCYIAPEALLLGRQNKSKQRKKRQRHIKE